MGIPIPGKDGLYIETGPSFPNIPNTRSNRHTAAMSVSNQPIHTRQRSPTNLPACCPYLLLPLVSPQLPVEPPVCCCPGLYPGWPQPAVPPWPDSVLTLPPAAVTGPHSQSLTRQSGGAGVAVGPPGTREQWLGVQYAHIEKYNNIYCISP